MSIGKNIGIIVAAGIMTSGLALAPAQAQEDQQRGGGLFDNCTNFNNRYPPGVGRQHAHDQTSGTPVKNFRHNNRLYARAMKFNSDLDRDRDKIACEKA